MNVGLLLDIPRDKMEVIKLEQRDDPVMCAVLTINKWQKRDPQCEDLSIHIKGWKMLYDNVTRII